MEAEFSSALSLPPPPPPLSAPPPDFITLFNHLNTLLLSTPTPQSHPLLPTTTPAKLTRSSSTAAAHPKLTFFPTPLFTDTNSGGHLFHHLTTTLLSTASEPIKETNSKKKKKTKKKLSHLNLAFASTSLSTETQSTLLSLQKTPAPLRWLKPSTRATSPRAQSLMKSLSILEGALIGAMAGGIAGAFTYVCLHPIDTVKTKLQTKGAAQIYSGALDAALQTFRSGGVLGFYRGVSAVIVGSTFSSAVYFGTCEFGKSLFAKLPSYPAILIPPTAGAMGNIVSSAIMVPKELITQRMQAGAAGRSWEVLLRILQKDGIPGLYTGYSATLLRNLPAGILSYSSFEYLKAFVLSKTGKGHLEPAQSVCCGAMAGAISASLTTPLDVVKTRLMTQIHGEARSRIADTVRQILVEEGWAGLARGMGPRVLHSACFAALGYFAFETARLTLLHQYVQRMVDEEDD